MPSSMGNSFRWSNFSCQANLHEIGHVLILLDELGLDEIGINQDSNDAENISDRYNM